MAYERYLSASFVVWRVWSRAGSALACMMGDGKFGGGGAWAVRCAMLVGGGYGKICKILPKVNYFKSSSNTCNR